MTGVDAIRPAAGIRCGPGCGFGCTVAAFEQASAEAAALVEALGGPPWQVRLWENAGWCYAAEHASKQFTVHPIRHGSAVAGGWSILGYTAYINSHPNVVRRGATPGAAWTSAYLALKDVVRGQQELLCEAKRMNTIQHARRKYDAQR